MSKIITQEHAFILAHDYGLDPREGLKCDKYIIGERDLRFMVFGCFDHTTSILIKYHQDELVPT